MLQIKKLNLTINCFGVACLTVIMPFDRVPSAGEEIEVNLDSPDTSTEEGCWGKESGSFEFKLYEGCSDIYVVEDTVYATSELAMGDAEDY